MDVEAAEEPEVYNVISSLKINQRIKEGENPHTKETVVPYVLWGVNKQIYAAVAVM